MDMTLNEILAGLVAFKGGIAIVWIAIFLVMERLRPASPEPEEVKRHPFARIGRNLTLFAVNGGASALLVVPLTAAAAAASPVQRPDWLGGLPGIAVDILLLDLFIYWWHRFTHVVSFLWRFHSVHHLDRFLDASSAVRFHVGEVLMSACARAAFIFALGIPLATVLVYETLLIMGTVFHHSNVRLPEKMEKALSLIIVTPSIHWVHHHAVRRDTDSNYSTVFSLWDRIFGTRSPTHRAADMTIGVEGEDEETLAALALRPFR